MHDAKVVEHCCGVVAMLSLRCAENAETLVDSGRHTLLATALRAHAANCVPVSRQACPAVPNIASRSIALRPTVLCARVCLCMRMRVRCLRLRRSDVWWVPQLVSEGLEKLLNIVMVTHDSSRDQAKAALRDLGLEHGGHQDYKPQL